MEAGLYPPGCPPGSPGPDVLLQHRAPTQGQSFSEDRRSSSAVGVDTPMEELLATGLTPGASGQSLPVGRCRGGVATVFQPGWTPRRPPSAWSDPCPAMALPRWPRRCRNSHRDQGGLHLPPVLAAGAVEGQEYHVGHPAQLQHPGAEHAGAVPFRPRRT